MEEKINYDDLISQKEAADLRGVTRSAINELVKRGRLKVVEIAGKKFLSRSEVTTFEGQKGKALEDKNSEVSSKKSKTEKLSKEKAEVGK